MFTKKLDKILYNFSKLTKDLEKFIDNTHLEIEVHREIVREAEIELERVSGEQNRAKQALGNIQKIIGE